MFLCRMGKKKYTAQNICLHDIIITINPYLKQSFWRFILDILLSKKHYSHNFNNSYVCKFLYDEKIES